VEKSCDSQILIAAIVEHDPASAQKMSDIGDIGSLPALAVVKAGGKIEC
jgi:hypothetical protein